MGRLIVVESRETAAVAAAEVPPVELSTKCFLLMKYFSDYTRWLCWGTWGLGKPLWSRDLFTPSSPSNIGGCRWNNFSNYELMTTLFMTRPGKIPCVFHGQNLT